MSSERFAFNAVIWLLLMLAFQSDYWRIVCLCNTLLNGVLALSSFIIPKVRDYLGRRTQAKENNLNYYLFKDKVKKGKVNNFEHEAPIERKHFFD